MRPVRAVVNQAVDVPGQLRVRLFLQTIVVGDALGVRQRERPDFRVAAEEIAAVRIIVDEAVLYNHGRDAAPQTVAHDAVIVRDGAVGILGVDRIARHQAVVLDAELAKLTEDVQPDGGARVGHGLVIITVADEHIRAARLIRRSRRIQMQAHEQIGIIFCCKFHPRQDLPNRSDILAGAIVGTRQRHAHVAVSFQFLFEVQRELHGDIALNVISVDRAAVRVAVAGIKRDEQPAFRRDKLRGFGRQSAGAQQRHAQDGRQNCRKKSFHGNM